MALNYFDPATAICIILSVLTVTLFFILTPLNKIKENKHLVFSIALIILSMFLIINQHLNDASQLDFKTIMLGLAWCILGGITGAFIGMSSEGMGKAGFSVTQILATRFYLLIAVSIIGFFLLPDSAPIVIDWKYYIFASLIIVIFPLVMYQTAVKTLGALIVSLIEPFTPVFTYLLQIFVGDYNFNLTTIVLLVVSSSAIIWFVKIEQDVAQARSMNLALSKS
jgi:drug/metabolite transporter (DMT)-like permease